MSSFPEMLLLIEKFHICQKEHTPSWQTALIREYVNGEKRLEGIFSPSDYSGSLAGWLVGSPRNLLYLQICIFF